MNNIYKTNRFNYDESWTRPRFYSFSTWPDDITKYYLTVTDKRDRIVAPSCFLAFKYTGDIKRLVEDKLEKYFENKLSTIKQKLYEADAEKSNEDISRYAKDYAPLSYLFDALDLDDCEFIVQDINEQNYDGAFCDILCTIPHGVKTYKLDGPKRTFEINDENTVPLLGWDGETGYGDDDVQKKDRYFPYAIEPYRRRLTFVPKEYDKRDEFEFNMIVPLYKRGINDIERSEEEYVIDTCYGNDTETPVYIPLGIWINQLSDDTNTAKPITITTGNSPTNPPKYTASWTLSISLQIKPYFSSNALTVHANSADDISQTMENFSSVLGEMRKVGKDVAKLSGQIGSCSNSNRPGNYDKDTFAGYTELKKMQQANYADLIKRIERIENMLKKSTIWRGEY